MKIKYLFAACFLSISLMISSCGSLYKPRFAEHTQELDYFVVFLDSLGLLLFIVPGVVALSIDYATGALFLTPEQLKEQEIPASPKKVRSLLYNNKKDLENNLTSL